MDESDIDPETGAPTIYRGYKLFNALRSGQILTLRNGTKVERWDPNTYMQDYLYGQATSHKHNISISGLMTSSATGPLWAMRRTILS